MYGKQACQETSTEYSHIDTWGGRMALRLLRARYCSTTSLPPEATQHAPSAETDAATFGPWLRELPGPGDMVWPPGHLSSAELCLLQDSAAQSQAAHMADGFKAGWLVRPSLQQALETYFDTQGTRCTCRSCRPGSLPSWLRSARCRLPCSSCNNMARNNNLMSHDHCTIPTGG